MQMPYSEDSLWRLHSISSRRSSKNRRILILKDKSIGLIKWWKAGLKNLPVSTSVKRRIIRRAIRDYQIGECQNSAYPFKDCTYESSIWPNFRPWWLREERKYGCITRMQVLCAPPIRTVISTAASNSLLTIQLRALFFEQFFNSSTMFDLPFSWAYQIAVCPALSFILGSAPISHRSRTTSSGPISAA